MSAQELDVVGIGNAIVDILSQTKDEFLGENDLVKGSMALIGEHEAVTLYDKMGPAVEVSGGSAANTVAALASLGGKAGYIGKIAADQLGMVFRHDIKAAGVVYDTEPLKDAEPTARCMVLITPDAERTMCTYLGASPFLNAEDVNAEMISGAQVTYMEGYLFDREEAKKAFRAAAEIARKAGRKVSLSLSDRFCVERHKDDFLDLIENHIDILFANEDEITALYATDDFDKAVEYVRGHCEIACLTRSEKGSVIVTGDSLFKIPAMPIEELVDTTGAGDFYAAGFLYGFTQGLSIEEAGRIGAIAASEVIQHVGARPRIDLSQLVRDKLKLAA